jgi:chorismate mutase
MPEVRVRGIRGATTADANTREAILTATDELLQLMIDSNHVCAEDVASVFFTTTSDLTAEYPALAARALGWHDAALMCAHEMTVPHGLPMCIRILIHWNTPVQAAEVQHVYIRGAAHLRPDRSFSLKQA